MDPNPIKHAAVLIAYIRNEIEPSLALAGFHFSARNNPVNRDSANLWLDYCREAEVFSLRWERCIVRLVAELLDNQANVKVLAEAYLNKPESHEELIARITPFIESVKVQVAQLASDSH